MVRNFPSLLRHRLYRRKDFCLILQVIHPGEMRRNWTSQEMYLKRETRMMIRRIKEILGMMPKTRSLIKVMVHRMQDLPIRTIMQMMVMRALLRVHQMEILRQAVIHRAVIRRIIVRVEAVHPVAVHLEKLPPKIVLLEKLHLVVVLRAAVRKRAVLQAEEDPVPFGKVYLSAVTKPVSDRALL